MLVLWGRIASTESQSHWDDNGTLQRGLDCVGAMTRTSVLLCFPQKTESGSSEYEDTLLTNIGGGFGCCFKNKYFSVFFFFVCSNTD